MAISFLPYARIRTLFDEGQLEVACTPALNFDSDDYVTQMGILFQWA
jgi:hypothetical protein